MNIDVDIQFASLLYKHVYYILIGKTRWSLSEMPLGISFTQHTPKMKRAAQEQALMDAANVGIIDPLPSPPIRKCHSPMSAMYVSQPQIYPLNQLESPRQEVIQISA